MKGQAVRRSSSNDIKKSFDENVPQIGAQASRSGSEIGQSNVGMVTVQELRDRAPNFTRYFFGPLPALFGCASHSAIISTSLTHALR